MKNLYLALFAIITLAVLIQPAAAQTADKKPEPTANPSYDEALAKRLGGDEMGMRQYVMCFLKTGPLKVDDSAKRAELMKGHFGMINRLADEGKLVLAGPFSSGGDFRGIYIFNVQTIEEAQRLTETDPSIKEGYFKVEFIKWYGSAGLMDVNNIHKKISKKAN